jgi:hypothetical protein
MGDHEYVLALEPDIDDLHFNSKSSESALPSPRLLDESLTISSDWQVEEKDLLSEQTAADKKTKGPKGRSKQRAAGCRNRRRRIWRQDRHGGGDRHRSMFQYNSGQRAGKR